MSEDVKVEEVPAPAPVKEDDKSFTIEFNLEGDMLEFCAKIGLEVLLKQRMNEIAESIKK